MHIEYHDIVALRIMQFLARRVTSTMRYLQSLRGIGTCLNHAARGYSARVIANSAGIQRWRRRQNDACLPPEEYVAPHGDIVRYRARDIYMRMHALTNATAHALVTQTRNVGSLDDYVLRERLSLVAVLDRLERSSSVPRARLICARALQRSRWCVGFGGNTRQGSKRWRVRLTCPVFDRSTYSCCFSARRFPRALLSPFLFPSLCLYSLKRRKRLILWVNLQSSANSSLGQFFLLKYFDSLK